MSIFKKKIKDESRKDEENNELENILIEMTSQIKELREKANKLQDLEERISMLEADYKDLNQELLNQRDALTNIKNTGRRYHSGMNDINNSLNGIDYEQMRLKIKNKK